MAVRVRGIIASVLLVAFVFMSIGALLPRNKTVEKRVSDTNRARSLSFVGWNNPTETPKPPTPPPNIRSPTEKTQHPYRISFPDDFRLLIGVMSPSWSSARRQIIRNAYRQLPDDLPVDVVFVQADTVSFNEKNNDRVMGMYQVAMTWENNTFH